MNNQFTAAFFNDISKSHFPGHLGIIITKVDEWSLEGEMHIEKKLFAPNGYIHAGSIVTFADTIAGYSVISNLPEGGKMFTTLELKSNFLGSAKEGMLVAKSFLEHAGRTTQVWRVEVNHKDTGKKLAVFSCTQLILY